MRKMATPSAMSPATWAVKTGEESATGAAFCLPSGGRTPGDGDGPGVSEGEIAGNRPAALPALMSELEMSELETPLSSGMGPSGSAVSGGALAEDLAGDADADGAAVTATVTAAEGGAHFAVVTTAAVAVSFTELTELAPAATGIWA